MICNGFFGAGDAMVFFWIFLSISGARTSNGATQQAVSLT
jgi:hypothetical protein